MRRLVSLLLSSVGMKTVMALSGLALYGFLAGHIVGNLQLFSGTAFDRYAHMLSSNPLIVPTELVLIALLCVHVASGIAVTTGNWRARPTAYAVVADAEGPSRRSFASRTMIWTGALVLIFAVVHVAQFKYGPAEADGYVRTIGGVEMRDLRRLVLEVFREPLWTGAYAVAMVVLGFHLFHALSSSLQSLGIFHPRYENALLVATGAVAVAIAGGFLALPLLVVAGLIR